MCGNTSGQCVGHKVSWVLVMVGALNFGVFGVAKFDVLNTILGGAPMLERLVYALIGLAGVMMLLGGKCKKCKGGGDSCCKPGTGNTMGGGMQSK